MSERKSHYEWLGVERTATTSEIKKAYRTKSLTMHPDRGGSNEEFAALSNAYSVLVDDEKRRVYDLTGRDDGGDDGSAGGGARGGMHGGIPEEIFQMFMNGGGAFFRGAHNAQPNGGAGGSSVYMMRSTDSIVTIKLTLEELYSGKTIKLKNRRKIECKKCLESRVSCPSCGALHPMIQPSNCGVCSNRRFIYCGDRDARETCSDCGDTMLMDDESILEVQIPAGMPASGRVTVAGAGGQQLGRAPGNIVVVMEEKPHAVFARNAATGDLETTVRLSLLEALTGFARVITLLSGKQYPVGRTAQTKHGEKCTLTGGGLPSSHHGATMTNLVITFEVIYPTDDETLSALKKILPVPNTVPSSVPSSVPNADPNTRPHNHNCNQN